MEVNNDTNINPFNCKLIEELWAKEKIAPQNFLLSDGKRFCLGFGISNCENYKICNECKHRYFNNAEGMNMILKNKDLTLEDFNNINILVIYIYYHEGGIIFNNGWIDLRLTITTDGYFACSFVDIEDVSPYDDNITIPSLLSIIENLKSQKVSIDVDNKWEEIKFEVNTLKSLN